MRHPEYPLWCAISLVVVLLPAPWHWRSRNISTVCLIWWLSLYNIITLINTLLWADNYADKAPVWADISARAISVIPFGIPLCSLAQMRRLAFVASPNSPLITARTRKRQCIEEFVICVILPILMVPLVYIVQGHRYDIFESLGPVIPDVFSWLAIVIRYVLPVVFSIISLIYASMAMKWFIVRRRQFRAVLSGSGLTTSRYLRLLGLAVSDSFLVVLISLFDLLVRLVYFHSSIMPVMSWQSVHNNFSLISQYPEEQAVMMSTVMVVVVPVYSGTLYSIVFFIFFGFGEETVAEYVSLWKKLSLLCGAAIPRNRQSAQDTAQPTLGCQVTGLDGKSWDEGESSAPVRPEGDSINGSFPAIAVTVERSVV